MNPLILMFLLACGDAPHDHDHPHEHGDPAHEGHAHDDDAMAKPAAMIEAPLGSHTARLTPSAESLELVVLDAKGQPVTAEGEARVVLTGTGEAAQRVVLAPSGASWTGSAKAVGAPGYVAVVQVTVRGNRDSARFTWGEVPKTEPAPHDHAGDHAGHDHAGHDHGADGHAH